MNPSNEKKLSLLFTVLTLNITNAFSQENIQFAEAQNYFVKNNFISNDLKTHKITKAVDFEKIFGMASVMGANGKPTPIDFKKQFVIAVINNETDISTSFTPIKLEKIGAKKLHFEFQSHFGEKQSFTIRPFILIVVDRKFKNYKIELSTFAVK